MSSLGYDDDSLLPLSGIQHFAYCPRQWALIHVERQWVENTPTVEGRHLHEKVHSHLSAEARGDILIARSLPLVSRRLGLYGVADVVEFLRPATERSECLLELPGRSGRWVVRPVEYKRGKVKPDRRDEAQLCAQAMCLEEMLSVRIEYGALFYGRTQSRTQVEFTKPLRALVKELAGNMHEVFGSRVTPAPADLGKCGLCSLADVCLPKVVARKRSYVDRYVQSVFDRSCEQIDSGD